MSRWRIVPGALTERERDYTAGFDCHNLDTEAVVHIELNQTISGPVSDLVSALRAVAQTLVITSSGEPGPRLN